jgi:biotin synthase-like enzyme
VTDDILDEARRQVLGGGAGLDTGQVLRCLRLPDDRLDEALSLAHAVRMRWCGPEVEVEGIVSVKTGGCPEDCQSAGMQLCCGGIAGMGETLPQRAELASELASLEPDEVPLNFLNPRPGTPLANRPRLAAADALRTIAAFRLALPRTVLRYAGGRELTLGDLGTEAGMLGGINAIIVGNYLTTLGRPAQADLEMLSRLRMPIKALSGHPLTAGASAAIPAARGTVPNGTRRLRA